MGGSTSASSARRPCRGAHPDFNHLKDETKSVDIIALCDVWDGGKWKEGGREVGRGLYYSAARCGLEPQGKDKDRITKDYRRLLDCKDIDAFLIATPDHWHARMSIDAMEAGKDVYCEKPMTHTIDEARKVAETVRKTKQVFTVGVQSTADPRWKMANQMITEGKIGHVMQGQTSYYRNSNEGQWRYYPLLKEMNPKTVDWKMFLGTDFGLAPEMPFNRAKYAQWRCYWEFGGGMYTDLFVHQLTHLITAMGVRFPRRVVGAGGLYLEYDGRNVPDVATVVADYDEGCQLLITATMCNDVQLPEVIRGHTATIKFEPAPHEGFSVIQQKLEGRPAPPGTNQGEGETGSVPRSPARIPVRSGNTSSSACGRVTRKPSARPTWATRRSPRSTWECNPTGRARPTTSTRRTAGSSPPTAPGRPAGKSGASSAASPTRSSAGRPATTGSLLQPPSYQKLEETGSAARTRPKTPEGRKRCQEPKKPSCMGEPAIGSWHLIMHLNWRAKPCLRDTKFLRSLQDIE